MGGSPSPKPTKDGVIVFYENVKVEITNGKVRILIPTKKTVVVDQGTGEVTQEG